jgi:hypothetical protein
MGPDPDLATQNNADPDPKPCQPPWTALDRLKSCLAALFLSHNPHHHLSRVLLIIVFFHLQEL